MRIISNLLEVLQKHMKWIKGEDGGERADLRGADLHGAKLYEADLYGADLRGADLHGAKLSGADLREADLSRVDLHEADLSGAKLSGADLRESNLSRADLHGAKLSGADLREADLYGADLREANLYEADLYEANLSRADLYGAELHEANLSRANLHGATIDDAMRIRFFPMCCPEEGAFVGFKKCANDAIVKLMIPEDAKRSSAYGRKCRCSKALVIEITDKDGKQLTDVVSQYDSGFVYRTGEIVTPMKPYDDNRWNECSSGIHFFITKQEAIDY